MAIVRKLNKVNLERDSVHTETECTYSIGVDPAGRQFLQIDTYGSASRKVPGKKSQSVRFSHEALAQLGRILPDELHVSYP
jgi:hypothetical protein